MVRGGSSAIAGKQIGYGQLTGPGWLATTGSSLLKQDDQLPTAPAANSATRAVNGAVSPRIMTLHQK
jgi:hypothetical protein